MKVLIDGKEVKALTDVKIIIENFDWYGNEAELQLTLTSEGLITDVVREDKEDQTTNVVETDSKTYDELFSVLTYSPDPDWS